MLSMKIWDDYLSLKKADSLDFFNSEAPGIYTKSLCVTECCQIVNDDYLRVRVLPSLLGGYLFI